MSRDDMLRILESLDAMQKDLTHIVMMLNRHANDPEVVRRLAKKIEKLL